MKRTISILALLTAATIGVAGCGGDDDVSAANTGGSSNASGAPASAGGDSSTPTGGDSGTPTGGASSGNVMCDPEQNGVALPAAPGTLAPLTLALSHVAPSHLARRCPVMSRYNSA